jgi:hypothetical protein
VADFNLSKIVEDTGSGRSTIANMNPRWLVSAAALAGSLQVEEACRQPGDVSCRQAARRLPFRLLTPARDRRLLPVAQHALAALSFLSAAATSPLR